MRTHQREYEADQRRQPSPATPIVDRGDSLEAHAAAIGNAAFSGVVARRPGRFRTSALPAAVVARRIDRPLADDARDAAEDEQLTTGDFMAWGTHSTTTAEGKPYGGDRVTLNAYNKSKMGPELEGLAHDVDMLRPLVKAWSASVATIDTIKMKTGVDPRTPQAYRAEVRAMGDAMGNTRDPTGVAVLDAFGRGGARINSGSLSAATEKLNQAINSILTVQGKLEQYRSKLEQMKLQAKIAKEKDKLQKIQEKIQLISDVITKVATVAAAATGALAAVSAAASAAEPFVKRADTLGSLGVMSEGKNYSRANKGAAAVAGAGGLISGFLTATVFAKEIKTIQEQISRLEGKIADLKAKDLQIEGANLNRELDTAASVYRETSEVVFKEQHSFSTAMREAGRTWDQRGLTKKEAAARGRSAKPGRGSKVSMEGILYMAAALQSRKSARTAVANLFQQLPRLSQAEDIMTRALHYSYAAVSPKDGGDPDEMGITDVPIDFRGNPKYAPGGRAPDKKTMADAARLRNTVAYVGGARRGVEADAAQAQVEDNFLRMIADSTGQAIA